MASGSEFESLSLRLRQIHARAHYTIPVPPAVRSALPFGYAAVGSRAEEFAHDPRQALERSELPDLWPEVGSRFMTRLLSGQDLEGSWIIVQPGVYRFNIYSLHR
jgi:hypothetical protein